MLVSVIIPFFSGVNWLEEALSSVFNQTYKNYEVILINDGSTEDLDEILELYEKKIIYKKIKNSGPGTARNIGIELAKGKYLAFLDSDDLWLESKLEKQINYMVNNKIKWCHTSYETFSNESGKRISEIKLNKISGNLFHKFLLSCPIATPCVIVEKKILLKNNFQFSPEMRFGQDYFLWLNISSIEKIGVLNEILTRVRIRGGNTSRKAYNQIYAKSKINEYLNTKRGTHLSSKIPKYIRIIFRMSSIGIKLINKISYKNELLSKIIYIPIYFYTKFLNKILNEK